ncbi:MAG: M6 family metalloprotease domain-containing protein, partial [Candidatus Altiarchaeum hamiconexum]|nr:M6 family metalloprotease domain-containing protein [Candidatus Altarchaeum hamiconexum]
GNQKILVIPVMFSDVKNSTTLGDLNKTLKNLTEYYYNVSYGKLNLTYEINDWIALPKPMAFYGADGGFGNTIYGRIDKLNVISNQLGKDTVKAVDLSTNFSKYDHLIIIHAGNDQANDEGCKDCIWSMMFPYIGVETDDNCIIYSDGVVCEYVDYALTVSETDPFGVYAHEFGHDLGLPDLYDTNNGSSVVDDYELMDSGGWFNAHPGAFSKSKLNFVDELVVYNETKNITIFPAENNDTIIKIIGGNPDSWQYYLIEMRKKIGYDANLPNSYPNNALLIWKIDESFSDNQISKHAPMVSLNVYNESGNWTDVDGGISMNWALNQDNISLSVSQIPKGLNLTNRVLDNDIVKPVTCKFLDVYTGWPENDPQIFIFPTDYFTLNDNNVYIWAKIMGNTNDNITFEFIKNLNGTNILSYKNVSVIITKNMSHNIYNSWNWNIDTVNVSFKINSSVTGNWNVKILVNGVYTNYSLNFTISNKTDTKPPGVNLLPLQNITENTALVLWNASDAGINASGLKKYKIYYYDTDTVFGIYNLTYVIDKKEEIKEFMNRTFYGTPGHTYCFWVEAYDRAENYNISNKECVTLSRYDIFDTVE